MALPLSLSLSLSSGIRFPSDLCSNLLNRVHNVDSVPKNVDIYNWYVVLHTLHNDKNENISGFLETVGDLECLIR